MFIFSGSMIVWTLTHIRPRRSITGNFVGGYRGTAKGSRSCPVQLDIFCESLIWLWTGLVSWASNVPTANNILPPWNTKHKRKAESSGTAKCAALALLVSLCNYGIDVRGSSEHIFLVVEVRVLGNNMHLRWLQKSNSMISPKWHQWRQNSYPLLLQIFQSNDNLFGTDLLPFLQQYLQAKM